MAEVTRGRNLQRIGWHDGWLTVQFKAGTVYKYGPGVPRERAEQLLRVPYPDKLFSQVIKAKFPCQKEG